MRSFTVATDDEIRQLDKLAGELRCNPRRRAMARGLPIQQALDLFFAEQAGRVGSR